MAKVCALCRGTLQDADQLHYQLVCLCRQAQKLETSGDGDAASTLLKKQNSKLQAVLSVDPKHAKAQNSLGWIHEKEGNAPEAMECFLKAAQQGYVEAQYKLAHMHLHGSGLVQDKAEAARWFRQAAEQNHAPAQYAPGKMYTEGSGVAQDSVKACAWARRAAEQGHSLALCILGDFSFDGLGMPQDMGEAVR